MLVALTSGLFLIGGAALSWFLTAGRTEARLHHRITILSTTLKDLPVGDRAKMQLTTMLESDINQLAEHRELEPSRFSRRRHLIAVSALAGAFLIPIAYVIGLWVFESKSEPELGLPEKAGVATISLIVGAVASWLLRYWQTKKDLQP